MTRWLRWSGVGVSAAGAGLALFLTWMDRQGAIGRICGPGGGCEQILTSAYSEWMGLPTALYGAFFYLGVLLLLLIFPLLQESGRELVLNLLLAGTGAAAVISLGLTLYGLYGVGTSCVYCLTSLGLVMLLLGLLAAARVRGGRLGRFQGGSRGVWQGAALAALAAALLLGGLLVQQLFFAPARGPSQADPARQRMIRALAPDGVSLGDPAAPVRVVEFFDLACPHCQRFTLEVFPKIRRRYIASGDVLWTFRSFPLPRSHPHSLYAHAVLESLPPPAFLSAKKRIMRQAARWDARRNASPVPYFRSLRKHLGLNARSGPPEALGRRLLRRRRLYGRLGIRQTPSFLVNGELVEGGRSFSEWRGILRRHLPDG